MKTIIVYWAVLKTSTGAIIGTITAYWTTLKAFIKVIIKTIVKYWITLKTRWKRLLLYPVGCIVLQFILVIWLMYRSGEITKVSVCIIDNYYVMRIRDFFEIRANLFEEMEYTCEDTTRIMRKVEFYSQAKVYIIRPFFENLKSRFVQTWFHIYIIIPLWVILLICVWYKRKDIFGSRKLQKINNSVNSESAKKEESEVKPMENKLKIADRKTITESELNSKPIEKESKGTGLNLSQEQKKLLEKFSKKLDTKGKQDE